MRIIASVTWKRQKGEEFVDQRYSRRHLWRFDGGAEVPASSSPHVVAVPMSDASAVDPEEAFVASLSSCHMLWFLSLAAMGAWVVERYEDDAVGVMAKSDDGGFWMETVTLRPRIVWSGRSPPPAELERLHVKAHERCFIARSVRSKVSVEAQA